MSGKTKAKKRTQRKYWGRGDFKSRADAAKSKDKTYTMTNQEKRIKKLNKIIELRGLYCFYCGEQMRNKDMTIEHLMAKSNGGTNDLHNLYLAHSWCNKEAGSNYTKDKKKMRETRTEEAWYRCAQNNPSV